MSEEKDRRDVPSIIGTLERLKQGLDSVGLKSLINDGTLQYRATHKTLKEYYEYYYPERTPTVIAIDCTKDVTLNGVDVIAVKDKTDV